MNLFENSKYFIITFILTLIMGYYLGLAISTVIDYRLRDATIHMPKPKNNIIIQVTEDPLKTKVKVKDNSKKIEKFVNFEAKSKHSSKCKHNHSKSKKKKNGSKKKRTLETFVNPKKKKKASKPQRSAR